MPITLSKDAYIFIKSHFFKITILIRALKYHTSPPSPVHTLPYLFHVMQFTLSYPKEYEFQQFEPKQAKSDVALQKKLIEFITFMSGQIGKLLDKSPSSYKQISSCFTSNFISQVISGFLKEKNFDFDLIEQQVTKGGVYLLLGSFTSIVSINTQHFSAFVCEVTVTDETEFSLRLHRQQRYLIFELRLG